MTKDHFKRSLVGPGVGKVLKLPDPLCLILNMDRGQLQRAPSFGTFHYMNGSEFIMEWYGWGL